MRTEQLIRALAADAPAPAPMQATLFAGLIPAALLGMAGLWAVLGYRPDLATALVTPVSALRLVLTLALFAVAVPMCLAVARPEGVARLWPLAVVAALALALFGWTLLSTPPEARLAGIYGKTLVACLVTVPLISVLPVSAVMTMMRRGAVTRPALAGALAGLAGGGVGAAIYALHCTEDNPLFYVTWYGLAILIVTAVSSLVGSRVLRW